MIDLDFFKQINDNYGHVFGDECLRRVASTLSSKVARPTDCVSRYGGEEFVILLPNTNATACSMLAQRMIEAIAELELYNNPKACPYHLLHWRYNTYSRFQNKTKNSLIQNS